MPRVFFLLSLWFGALACAGAQEVEVAQVRFSSPRAPNGAPGNWLEMEVGLQARPAAAAPGQMVSRVRVAVLLGFELPARAGAERRVEHYRAEAECVALEPGRADVRFYLPPELVKRDQLRGDPKLWGVELAVAGQPVPASRGAYVATLASAEQRTAFQAKASLAAANDGLLQPQYLTPFADAYGRSTPSFVRRDGR